MYKLLIVEDEEIFRNVLPIIIDWNSIGYEIAGVVENGYKALEFLNSNEVDVILTDIRMPVLNGLELAMEVKSRFPSIKVLLLTAFNEFDYARKGIECGVYRYILKSDEEEVIAQNFIQLKKILDNEKRLALAGEETWRQREIIFRELLENSSKIDSDTLKKAQSLGWIDPASDYRIVLFQLDEYKYLAFNSGVDKVQNINRFIRDYLYQSIEINDMGTVISLSDMVCAIWRSADNLTRALTDIFKSLTEELLLTEKSICECLDLSCAVSIKAGSLSDLPSAFESAKRALRHKAYIGGSILNYTDLCGNNNDLPFDEAEKLLKGIMPLFNSKDTEGLIEYIKKLKDYFIEAKFTDAGMISGLVIKLIFELAADIGNMGLKADSLLIKCNYIIKEIGYCETIPLIFSKLEAFVIEAFVLVNEENCIQNRKIVDEALKYIQTNFASQISLEGLARHLNVHPVHLSRLLSRDLGKTFKRILMETRIEQAKKLLKDIDYRVYEISGMVGYEKARYFSELFRTMTGLTPLEYREKYKN